MEVDSRGREERPRRRILSEVCIAALEDRASWRQSVEALCATWYKVDR